MKKYIILSLAVLVLLASLMLVTAAETEDGSAGHTWQVTHADGTTEYVDGFYTPFTTASNGDYFKLIPDYIEVEGFVECKNDVAMTLDYGSSVIVHPDNTITTQMISLSNGSVTIKGDGAKVFLQNNVRSYIQANADLTMIGGEKGITVHGPCAVNCGGSANVELRNCYFFKNSGNMRSLVGVRTNSRVTAYDSVFHVVDNRNAVLVCNTATLKLVDSAIVNSNGGTGGIDIDPESSPKMSTEGTCYLFCGKDSGTTVQTLTLGAGTATSFDPAGYYDKSTVCLTRNESRGFTLPYFVEPSKEEDVKFEKDSFYVLERSALLADEPSDAVWRVEDSRGVVRGYSSSFNYPLLDARNGDRLVLLRTVTLKDSLSFALSVGVTVDLNGFSIISDPLMHTVFDYAIFRAHGNGSINIELNGGCIVCLDGAVLDLQGVDCTVDLGESYLLADTLASSDSSLTLMGGAAELRAEAPLIASSLVLSGCTLYSKNAISASSVLVDGAVIASPGTVINSESVRLMGGAVVGGIEADSIVADLGFRFSQSLEITSADTVLAEDIVTVTVYTLSLNGFKLESSAVAFDTIYLTVAPDPFTDKQLSGSIWRVSRGGETVGYSGTFDHPFTAFDKDVTLTLLRSVTVTEGVFSQLNGDITVDIGKNSVTYAPTGGARSRPLFLLRGEGSFKLLAASGGRVLSDSAVVIDSSGIDIGFKLDKGYIFGKGAVACRGGSVTLDGGFYSALGGTALIKTDGDLTVNGATLYSDVDCLLVSAGGILDLNNSTVIADNGEVGSAGAVVMDGSSAIYGRVVADSFTAEDGALTSFDYSDASHHYSILGDHKRETVIYKPRGAGLSASKEVYTYRSAAYNSSASVGVSFRFGVGVTMYIYLDSSILAGEGDRCRVSVNGIVYNVSDRDYTDYTDGDGVTYSVITFPYIFPSDIDGDSTLTVGIGAKTEEYSFTVRGLMERAAQLMDEGERSAVYYYLAYADNVLGREDEGEPLPSLVSELNGGTSPLIRAVSIDPRRNRLNITLSRDITDATLRFIYGNRAYLYTFEDGRVTLPLHRLDQYTVMELTYGDKTAELDISDLYLTAKAADGASLDLFEKYMDYLLSLK